MKLVYAIGDIHGMVNKLERLYAKILLDIKSHNVDDATIVFLGDYIDRGPCSKEVLDFLMSLRDTDNLKHIMLKGNHEEMIVSAYHNPENLAVRQVWLANGGIQCRESFNCLTRDFTRHQAPEFLPYIMWLDALPLKYKVDDYVFVHGGYDMRKSYDEQEDEVLVWKRTKKSAFTYRECEYIIVHGHTPFIDPLNYPKQIGIDTGAYWADATKLTAVALTIPRTESKEDSRRFITTS